MECFSPVRLKCEVSPEHPNGYVDVACGKCEACITKKRIDWSTRLTYEAYYAGVSHFVTLTYAPEHLQISDSGYPEVSKEHVQLFFKRFRNNLKRNYGIEKIRYYLVAEYSPVPKRPHYHMLVFGAKIVPSVLQSIVFESWSKGIVSVYPITPRRISYVLKRHALPKDFGHPEGTNPPFNLMSRRPGLGSSYLSSSRIQYHKGNIGRQYMFLPDGSKRRIPRYYFEKLFSEDEKKVAKRIKQAYRKELEPKFENDFYQLYLEQQDFRRRFYERLNKGNKL